MYDCLDQYAADFASDKRRINWIASHFCLANSDTTPAQSWFSALLMKNAYQHGVADQYANLKSLTYVIPPLLSAKSFINELILVFGDKTSAKTARAALDKCKQGSTSIVDYNARFGPLAFQVRQHKDDAIIKYVDGLHPDVREECINVVGWSEAKTLAEKMNLAVEGAGRAEERASLPNRSNRPKLYQHPNKTQQVQFPVNIVMPSVAKPVPIPVPMEVDAVQTKYSNLKNPFTAIRSVCLKKGLCFKCIQPCDAETHMVNGERRCPNKNTTLSEKIALLNPSKTEEKPNLKVHQIAALSFEDQVEQEDSQALMELGENEREAVEWLLESYCQGLSEPNYPSFETLEEAVDVCAVKMEADSSNPRRIHVPMTLVEDGLLVPVMVLGDTGSETNLLDDCFARAHGMKLTKKEFPLICTGYDGSRGLEIKFKWHGRLRAAGISGGIEEFEIVLQVTRLGKQDVIIGCPWMKDVGCNFVLGKGKSYLTLGSQLIVTAPEQKKSSDTLICEIEILSSDSVKSSSFSSTESSINEPTSIQNETTSQISSKITSKFSVSEMFPTQRLSPELENLCFKILTYLFFAGFRTTTSSSI